ncbi:SDR family NAD(P)-dependent oxidoreductase [Phytoactinopolyspora limicola]|uniref:SDR family NAD(P)-dependent oxidoreductase n=1 Tax=Phytoactinopolyspora limicola TaxID=2715536 RepID=UPI001A9C35ED|nr:SDR family oxidoreductase [Phytoactinopolyspora limicola]
MTNTTGPLDGRVALVTGAAAGLGQEFAVALAEAGATVAGLDVADQSATARRVGATYLAVAADVTDPAQVKAAVASVAAQHGGLHVLVNNAGIYPPIPFEDTTPDDLRRILAVNVEGAFYCAQESLPHLRRAGWGRIVNVVTGAIFVGPPDIVAYTTSKAALVGLTRSLATAVGADGITVNAIAPGLVRTDTAARSTGADGGFERVAGMQRIPRVGEPADLLSTLLYVCDPATSFLTGQTINVDGGSAFL